MTTLELYKKHKSGTVSRDKFLYEVRRDTNLPWVTNVTSYDDAVKILKNKGIIREMDANVQIDPAVDLVNPYFLKKGIQSILSKEKELTNDSYVNALNKAAKNLIKDPNFYEVDMFANADEIEKEDSKLQMEPVKKDNFNDKAREMKKVKGHTHHKANTKVSTKENKKGKPKGVEIMKEAVLDELVSSLKKKDLVKEDVHPTYNVGAEVHTPDGEGTIKEIIGSTFTIEMKDGSLKDYQVNVVDKHTEKAKETQKDEALTKDELDAAWAQRDKENPKVFGGMLTDPEHWKKPLDPETIKKYIDKYKHDKKKMKALKELVMLKTQKGTNIPGGIFGTDSSATSYINSLEPSAKSQIKKVSVV
jgi:hypothetical protein